MQENPANNGGCSDLDCVQIVYVFKVHCTKERSGKNCCDLVPMFNNLTINFKIFD